MPDEAIVYLPPSAGDDRWLDLCAQRAATRGYAVIAVVRRWDDLVSTLVDHRDAVVIVPDRRDLPGIVALSDPVSQAEVHRRAHRMRPERVRR